MTCRMSGGRFARGNEVPQEIRDKITEARKTMIDINAEFAKDPIDREVILELHAKHFSLLQEISEWYITQRMDAAENK